jgi:hypothetical protein
MLEAGPRRRRQRHPSLMLPRWRWCQSYSVSLLTWPRWPSPPMLRSLQPLCRWDMIPTSGAAHASLGRIGINQGRRQFSCWTMLRSRSTGTGFRQGAIPSTRPYRQRCPPNMMISARLARYVELGRSLLFGFFPFLMTLTWFFTQALFEQSWAKSEFLRHEQGA